MVSLGNLQNILCEAYTNPIELPQETFRTLWETYVNRSGSSFQQCLWLLCVLFSFFETLRIPVTLGRRALRAPRGIHMTHLQAQHGGLYNHFDESGLRARTIRVT